MASKTAFSQGSIPSSEVAPTRIPEASEAFDLNKYRESEEAKKVVAWVNSVYTQAKQERSQKQLQWFQNMSMFFGRQWAEQLRTTAPEGYRDKLIVPKKPYYKDRRTINRTRSFVRTEISKFLSQPPNAVAVPASADDEDIRAAYAAEQAWTSISDAHNLDQHFSYAVWWMVVTGNGFLKTWWDDAVVDKVSGDQGDIRFGNVTPFNLLVPDLREVDIEDQPYVINAYKKSVDWCKRFWPDVDFTPSSNGEATVLEEGYLNLSTAGKSPDSVTVFETWCKPGANQWLPEGGIIITVDDKLVSIYKEGMPYKHGQFPFTKLAHIPTATFYADSPLVDTNELQKEYNQLRTEISYAGKIAAKPQLLAQRGSVVVSKITNEPGQVIEYKPGFQPPTPMPMSPLPQYYVDQQDRILQDWEDVSGQHEVSKGQAPTGVTAGTAINYLQEKDDQFLTPQYRSIEWAHEKLANQTISLFVQYVDRKRKIKVVGTDSSFDTLLLEGSDLKNGQDIRIEKGSSIGKSQAARKAEIMDMFSIGLIDQPNALKLMEIGGVQKVMDTMNVAEKKAQRENMRMKLLKDEDVQLHVMEWMGGMAEGGDPQLGEPSSVLPGVDPLAAPDPMESSVMDAPMPQQQPASAPPVVRVDDFDVHELHIEVHNRFRMSQEYETLTPAVKNQFALHVAMHEQMVAQKQMAAAMEQMTGASPEGEPAPGGEASPAEGPGATMAPNGAAPEAPTTEGGI